jgi:phosphate transport system ATP-binding protein
MDPSIHIEKLNAWFGAKQALFDIGMEIPSRKATAIIGPSGCGKSTFVRCLNRMHETLPDTRVEGKVAIGDLDVYGKGVSPVWIRRRVGMVFQKPNPFPTMSIYDNVAAGLKLNGFRNRRELDTVVERSLKQAALWDEVKDDLKKKSGASLSGGQQQRLCIARALAVEPEVLLMDEPASALDPISTAKIEDLIFELKKEYTVITPRDENERGCQLSILVDEHGKEVFGKLEAAGVTCDFREPNVIRVAPTPLYNTFHEVWRFAKILRQEES